MPADPITLINQRLDAIEKRLNQLEKWQLDGHKIAT